MPSDRWGKEEKMNKIINQKRYNTETARCLGLWENGHYRNDFSFCRETLYVKKTGEYFLHGEGGAMSKYSTSRGNDVTGGEELIPLSYEKSMEWAEEHLDSDECTAVFGNMEEDAEEGAEKEKILLTLPKDIIKALKEKKETTGANISWIVAKALKESGY